MGCDLVEMLFQSCWRCFSRPPLHSLPLYSRILQPTASFATTTSFQREQPKKAQRNVGKAVPKRGVKSTFQMKRKKRSLEPKSKRPQPGERKALRKRVVLSNVNALKIEGMEDITAESIINTHQQQGLRSKVLGLTGQTIDQLRAVNAFKPTQAWGLFRRPGMLIREETIQYAKLFEDLSQDGVQKTVRRVIVGERGSGKTIMLLQAMTIAFLKDWVVINIPDGMTCWTRIPSCFLQIISAECAQLIKDQPKILC